MKDDKREMRSMLVKGEGMGRNSLRCKRYEREFLLILIVGDNIHNTGLYVQVGPCIPWPPGYQKSKPRVIETRV